MSGSNNTASGHSAQPNNFKDAWTQAAPFPIAENIRNLKVAVWEACQKSTQLEAALTYAEYGIPVLPCNWKPRQQDDGSFLFKKRPMLTDNGGVYLATTDKDLIREWWTKWPEALIGAAMGRRVGMWALDVDAKGDTDGREIWFNLQAEHDAVSTRAHETGTEGLHFLFQWDDNQAVGNATGKLPKGIGEVKGEGGYIIFPPSPYQLNGQTLSYHVKADTYPEPAPSWLYNLILGSRTKANGYASEGHWTWPDGWGQKKLDEICEKLRTAEKGHRDEARRSVPLYAGWFAGGAYDVDKAREEVIQAAKANPTAPADHVPETIRAFNKGVKEPKGQPENIRVEVLPKSQPHPSVSGSRT
jgi:hypothetical protein